MEISLTSELIIEWHELNGNEQRVSLKKVIHFHFLFF